MKKQQVINTNYRNFQHISSPRLKVLFFHDFCSTIWQEKTNRFKHTFSEFIESLSWPLKQRTSSHSASTFVALTNRSAFGCRWAQGFVPEAATSHGVLKDTFRHFTFSLLRVAMREAICIHIGQGGAMFLSFMYDFPELGTQVGWYSNKDVVKELE